MQKAFAALMMLAFVLSGCVNMPTPPEQITAVYVSDLKYKDCDCQSLSAELISLEIRERQLVVAQEHRIKKSYDQAILYDGVGSGDGLEAFELAMVRGEIKAVQKAMGLKGCR